MIQEQQKEMWGEVVATSLRNMDYSKIFSGGGAYAERVDDASQLRSAIERALHNNQNVSSFVDVVTQGVKSPLTQGMIEMRVRTAAE